jgi:biotin operon repressor
MSGQPAPRIRRTKPVTEYLLAHKNEHVSVGEMARATGLTHKQILDTMSYLKIRNGLPIEVIASGSVYVYRESSQQPPTAPNGHGKRIFEEVGTTRDGRVIVQDEEGALYAATEL